MNEYREKLEKIYQQLTEEEDQILKKEKPRYDGLCRDLKPSLDEPKQFVVRLRTPIDGAINIADMVQGDIAYKNSELDDMIIARSDGSPTYHLAAVVDDIDMGITHVIRGDDHLNNTPRQMHIYNALNESCPKYAHIPMIHGQDGKKLSKRHGALSILEYQKAGFLPEAITNYLSRLGWSWGDKEIFGVEELLGAFKLSDINKGSSRFDIEKLSWVNHQHMMNSDLGRLVGSVKPYLKTVSSTSESHLKRILELQRERSKNLVELAESIEYFFNAPTKYQAKHSRKFLTEMTKPILKELKGELELLSDWKTTLLEGVIEKVCQDRNLGMGKVAQPLRVALTGSTSSPGIAETLFLIGRDEVLERLDSALQFIDSGGNET